MPRLKPRPTQTTKRLADFDLVEWLCFTSGWRPPYVDGRRWKGRWLTWSSYLDDYEAVRTELIAHLGDRRQYLGRAGTLFGDHALAFRDRHGLAALGDATTDEIHSCGA